MNRMSDAEADLNHHHGSMNTGMRQLIQPLIIALILLLIPVAVRFMDGQSLFSGFVEAIGAFQKAHESLWSGAAIYLLAGGVCVAVGVPRLWVSAGAGALFNPWLGTGVALGASMMGAVILFQVGWWFLSPAKWRFLENRLGSFRSHFQERAFVWVLYARLFPLSNSTIISLFSGYCRVNFFSYFWASVIGFLPLTVAMCLFGGGSAGGRWLYFIVGFAVIAALHILTGWFAKRMKTAPNETHTATRKGSLQ